MHLLEDSADFVIVGTGAGGATAARVLAAAGHSVIMVEEGPSLRTPDRPRDIAGALLTATRNVGTQSTIGTAPIPVLQGRVVGGSTAINSGIIWRFPEDVLEDWQGRFGLGSLVERGRLTQAYETIERDLGIGPTNAKVLGGNNLLMAEACRVMGLPGKVIDRNAAGCKGSSECLHGCPNEARQSMDVSYVPRAIRDGARLHTHCRVQKVLIKKGRAVGVVGQRLDASLLKVEGSFRITARRGVIVSAGAIHTPLILRRSGLKGLVGERFQSHPGAAVIAKMPTPVRPSTGATQGYEVPMRAKGYKLETLALPPEMLAARFPGAGARWQRRLAELDHYASWAAQVRMRAHGRVREGFGGSALIRYEPLDVDVACVKEAVLLLCRMMFAVGAEEVLPGVASFPEVLTDARQVDALEGVRVKATDLHLLASHLFGTACAGGDPRHSVVDPRLESHEVPGLFVMDASVFPTNLGVNPQHPIMSLVFVAAEKLANEERRRQAG